MYPNTSVPRLQPDSFPIGWPQAKGRFRWYFDQYDQDLTLKSTNVINTLHIILVFSFVAVTAVLLGMTLVQRLRVRGIRQTWQSGRIGSLPVWPSAFIGIVLVFMIYTQNTVAAVDPLVFVGYFTGGILWLASVAMSATIVVTEYGIIPEVGQSGEAVGWGQISDYFEVEDTKRFHFAFLYQDFLGERKRLDLQVPLQEAEQFRSLVRSKLDVQIEGSVERVIRRKALEN